MRQNEVYFSAYSELDIQGSLEISSKGFLNCFSAVTKHIANVHV